LERFKQEALNVFETVSLNERRAFVLVDFPLPRPFFEIFFAVDIVSGCQPNSTVGKRLFSDAKVLDINAAFRKPKVGCVGAPVVVLGVEIVNRLVFVSDAV